MANVKENIQSIYQLFNQKILSLPERWHLPMLIVTILGGPVVIGSATFLIILISALNKNRIALLFGLGVVSSYVIVGVIKMLVARRRPNTNYAQKIKFSKYSFPSGHATISSVFYYGLALVLSSFNLPIFILLVAPFLAMCLVFWIGISRVYLGAHYLSDVLAGWGLGLLLTIILLITINIL